MDINQLFARHQSALFAAEDTRCSETRRTQFDLVEHYARCIGNFRKDLQLPVYRWR